MNRIALDLGFIQIYWYSIMILIAILLGLIVIYKEVKRQGVNEDFFINLAFYTIIVGIIGARLYYVLFNFNYYKNNLFEILEIWNGGLAIHGAIIFGTIFVFFYCKKYKVNFLKIADILVVGLLLAQAIGRWGNFFNQEAYGIVVERVQLEKMFIPKFIIEGMYIKGSYYTPTFLYEFIWNILGVIFLMIMRRRKYRKIGQTFSLYLMWYSIGRFFIEGLRTDSLMLGELRIAQFVSIVMFIIGFVIFFSKGRGSRFDNLYSQKEKIKY